MTPLAFDRLYEVVSDPERLHAAYTDVLGDLFRNPFWKSGTTAYLRVPWIQGRQGK